MKLLSIPLFCYRPEYDVESPLATNRALIIIAISIPKHPVLEDYTSKS